MSGACFIVEHERAVCGQLLRKGASPKLVVPTPYDPYITLSPMWMGSLATSPLMYCMSSVSLVAAESVLAR